jgi:hypothetical protein
MMTLAKVKTLYDQDFALWIEETVKQLKSGDLSEVDLENLIEEVEALGRREKRGLKSRLITLALLGLRCKMLFLLHFSHHCPFPIPHSLKAISFAYHHKVGRANS